MPSSALFYCQFFYCQIFQIPIKTGMYSYVPQFKKNIYIYISTNIKHHVDAYPHMHIFCTASALSQISCFSAQKPRLAQKHQHKQQQQQQRQQQTKQQTIAKPFQNRSGLGFDWL